MRVSAEKKSFVWLLAITLLCFCAVPGTLFADDKDSNTPPAKPAPAKPDSPAPLTERERWMLDRMEQLEKRVAELESKGNASAAPVPASQPASPSPDVAVT